MAENSGAKSANRIRKIAKTPANAPIVAVALWAATGGAPWLVGIYLSAMAVLTFVALILAPETKDVDYDDNIGVAASGSL